MKSFTQEQLNFFLVNMPREIKEAAKYFITAAVLQQTLEDNYPNGLILETVRESENTFTAHGFRAVVPERSSGRGDYRHSLPTVGVDVIETDGEGELFITGRTKCRAGVIPIWCDKTPEPEGEERSDIRREPRRRGDEYQLSEAAKIIFMATLMELEEMFAIEAFSGAMNAPKRKSLKTNTVYYTNRYGIAEEQPWALGAPVLLIKQVAEETIGSDGQLFDCHCLVAHGDGEKKQENMHSSDLFTQAELLELSSKPRSFQGPVPQAPRNEFFDKLHIAIKEAMSK